MKTIKTICVIAAALLAAGALAGCGMGSGAAKPTAGPSALPEMTGRASQAPSAEASAEPSASPEASVPAGTEAARSEEPDGSGQGGIPGFMEGAVVDPETVPELMAALGERADYRDMAVQSVTYKLYEGRQAYYVVLQGEGEATHPVYVFADGSIIDGAE